MIHINELKQDYFHYIENHLALVGERTGLTFKIGQKVRVKVVKADPTERAIDFELVSAEELAPLEAPKGRRKEANRGSSKHTNGRQTDKKKRPKKADSKYGPKKGKGKKGKKPFYKGVTKKKKKK